MTAPRAEPVAAPEPAPDQQPDVPTPPAEYECDACGRTFTGSPGGSGLLLWTRGDEVRYEEPPLCEECADKITMGALLKWSIEDEEEEG